MFVFSRGGTNSAVCPCLVEGVQTVQYVGVLVEEVQTVQCARV